MQNKRKHKSFRPIHFGVDNIMSFTVRASTFASAPIVKSVTSAYVFIDMSFAISAERFASITSDIHLETLFVDPYEKTHNHL